MKIGIVGLGLMGGSFALDIRNPFPNCKIYGYDNSKTNLNKALELGLIDQKIDLDGLKNMNIVLVSIQ
jgi:prephenate dehydrogenase